jgi:hypothetical protein
MVTVLRAVWSTQCLQVYMCCYVSDGVVVPQFACMSLVVDGIDVLLHV